MAARYRVLPLLADDAVAECDTVDERGDEHDQCDVVSWELDEVEQFDRRKAEQTEQTTNDQDIHVVRTGCPQDVLTIVDVALFRCVCGGCRTGCERNVRTEDRTETDEAGVGHCLSGCLFAATKRGGLATDYGEASEDERWQCTDCRTEGSACKGGEPERWITKRGSEYHLFVTVLRPAFGTRDRVFPAFVVV